MPQPPRPPSMPRKPPTAPPSGRPAPTPPPTASTAPPVPVPKRSRPAPAPPAVVQELPPVPVAEPEELYREEEPQPQETGRIRYREGVDELPEQISAAENAELSLTERHARWQSINRMLQSSSFASVIRYAELPKRVVMEVPPHKAPPVGGGLTVYWCCYCADWNVFEYFSTLGSDRCVCCGMSTKDYYNRNANNLWAKDL